MEWKLARVQDSNKNIVEIPSRWVHLKYYEAFNLLFRIENALRVFVYIILKNELKNDWANISMTLEESGQSTIAAVAKKRMVQAQSFGYLGHTIVSPILHLTSGELTHLIVDDAYWKYFKMHFKGNRDIIKNKLEEIATIRNSLAHFRTIKDDDITAIKHNAKHVLMGVEEFLYQVLNQRDVVPTNTEDLWYKQFRALKNDLCSLSYYQSSDTNWVRIVLSIKCITLKDDEWFPTYIDYDVLNVDSSSILKLFPSITELSTFMTEYVPYQQMPEDHNPTFYKSIQMVFARNKFSGNEELLHKEFTSLIQQILDESNLIQQDNLARGKLVYSISIGAQGTKKEDRINWKIDLSKFRTQVKQDDPSEYWGSFSGSLSDFVAGTTTYPWMPEDVSSYESPF